ncbi:MAG: helix-turn-helix transcriptional regulator [Sulfurospirillaceae bacterium]|nr:helix-turn-helix transcriptional regulator [Sulfurospirillaceae bacterium]
MQILNNTLERQLKCDMCYSKKISIIKNYIANILYTKKNNSTLEKIIETIYNSKGTAHIKDIAMTLHITPRQVERILKTYIGISPKKLSELIQFKASIDLLKNYNLSLVEVAVASGYFDQAHFIKNFKRFCGITPECFLKLLPDEIGKSPESPDSCISCFPFKIGNYIKLE